MSHFVNFFRVCAKLNYNSRCFRETHNIILKKLEKKNYINVKTYKSIAFLNILSKAFELIIARRINDLAKIHDFFFNQMKKRKNRNCETSLKLLTKQIYIVWNMNINKITTLLSINVVKAYDHVSREQLLHNFKIRRISIWIIVWANSFMQNRRISLIVKAK